MDLPSIEEYINATHRIIDVRRQRSVLEANVGKVAATNETGTHIYLATEDPRAVDAFQEMADPSWLLYIDRSVVELDVFRPRKGNRASWTTRNTKGRAGLVALGSLLVALEGTDFIITTQSNWSRLLNVIRLQIVDPWCGSCTSMIDLRPGEW
jgi:hypothetical protein